MSDELEVTRRRFHLPFSLKNLIVPTLFLICWEVVAKMGLYSTTFFPSLETVAATTYEWMSGRSLSPHPFFFVGTFIWDFNYTLFRTGVGFAIGSFLSVAAGVLIGWNRKLSDLFDPFIQMIRPIPRTAFLPFFLLFFGLGNLPAIVMTAFGCFMMVYLQVLQGVRLVAGDYRRVAISLGATETQLLRHAIIPGSLPYIFLGLRVGVAYAWTNVILAEMFAVNNGMGYLLWSGYQFMRLDLVVMVMLFLGLFGFLSDWIVLLMMRWKVKWAEELAGHRL